MAAFRAEPAEGRSGPRPAIRPVRDNWLVGFRLASHHRKPTVFVDSRQPEPYRVSSPQGRCCTELQPGRRQQSESMFLRQACRPLAWARAYQLAWLWVLGWAVELWAEPASRPPGGSPALPGWPAERGPVPHRKVPIRLLGPSLGPAQRQLTGW